MNSNLSIRSNIEETDDKYVAAVHEAAHAIATYSLGGYVDRISLERRGQIGGATYNQFPVLRRRNAAGQWEYERESLRLMHESSIVSDFAGPIAVSRITGTVPRGIAGDVRDMVSELKELFSSDIAQSCDYSKYSLQFQGMVLVLAVPPATCSKALQALDVVNGRGLIHMKIVRQLVTSARKSHEIIDRNWRAVQKLAAELVKTKRLDRKEIEQITGARFLFDRMKL